MAGFEDGIMPYEAIILSVAWFLPRISVWVSQSFKIPLAPIVIIVLMTAILRRAMRRPAENVAKMIEGPCASDVLEGGCTSLSGAKDGACFALRRV
jgi:hypothetical protein